jgi:hypothetical protein
MKDIANNIVENEEADILLQSMKQVVGMAPKRDNWRQ